MPVAPAPRPQKSERNNHARDQTRALRPGPVRSADSQQTTASASPCVDAHSLLPCPGLALIAHLTGMPVAPVRINGLPKIVAMCCKPPHTLGRPSLPPQDHPLIHRKCVWALCSNLVRHQCSIDHRQLRVR